MTFITCIAGTAFVRRGGIQTSMLASILQRGYWWGGGWWWIWWVVWIVIIIWAFAWWMPSANRRLVRAAPLEVLQHRLARGEITVEDYEARKAVLERDRQHLGGRAA